MTYYIKEILIFIYIAINSGTYFERFVDLGLSLNGLFFSFIFFICLLGIISASYIKSTIIRALYAVILFISSSIFLSYENITSDFLTYNSFISLVHAHGFIGEAAEQFRLQIITSILISFLLLASIVIKPYPLQENKAINSRSIFLTFIFSTKKNLFYILAPIFSVLLLMTILFLRGGDGGKGLPAPFITLAYSGLAAYESSKNVIGKRQDVQIKRNEKTINHDIIYIIDESIAPSYLDINSDYGVLTNLKDTDENINIFNFGYAAAITNCSSESNVTLRYGGTRDNYLTTIFTMPSLWQYAKHANLNTVYIDSQRTSMRLQNKMTAKEITYIDKFIQFDDISVVSRDLAAASELIKLINDNKNDFIIVNKIGAHFPIHDKYPDKFMKYKPVLPRGHFTNITDTGSRVGFDGKADEWLAYRNSYRNTILWGVGYFFKEILTKSNLNKATIIYTSDHGQDLHESGSAGVHTHCTSKPRIEEGLVPLIVIQGAKLKSLDFARNINKNKNNSSHYNIFPTLLSLMGYDSFETESIYGTSLDKLTNDVMTFNTSFHARLGQKSTWKKINIGDLIAPPECIQLEKNNFTKKCALN